MNKNKFTKARQWEGYKKSSGSVGCGRDQETSSKQRLNHHQTTGAFFAGRQVVRPGQLTPRLGELHHILIPYAIYKTRPNYQIFFPPLLRSRSPHNIPYLRNVHSSSPRRRHPCCRHVFPSSRASFFPTFFQRFPLIPPSFTRPSRRLPTSQ